ncbi:hypothetical protein DBR40_19905 [Pedobacter sp. KBW01]|nr:hypothetical protein DBR40_19905 [Pedobacter sp. KBW01]
MLLHFGVGVFFKEKTMFQKLLMGSARVAKIALLLSLIVDTLKYFQDECQSRGIAVDKPNVTNDQSSTDV